MGVLDNILGAFKKKEREEAEFAKEETEMVSSEEKYAGQVAEEAAFAPAGKEAEFGVQLESIRAQIQALKEMRGAVDERFSRVNEQIGELKQGMLEGEKRERELAEKADRASELVSSVQPEKLLEEVKGLEAKLEEESGAVEKIDSMQKASTEELKEVKAKMVAFRGLDTVVEMSEQMRKELGEIKGLEATIEKHADKVEFVYVELQKRAREIDDLFERVTVAESSLKNVSKDSEKVKAKVDGVAQRQDLVELKKGVEDKVKEISSALEELKKFRDEIEEVEKEEKKTFSELQKGLVEVREQKEATAKEITGLAKTVGKAGSLNAQFNKRIEETERKTEEGAKLLLEAVGKFADFEKELHEKFEELGAEIQKSEKEEEADRRALEAVQKNAAKIEKETAEAREGLETLVADLDTRVKALEKAGKKK